MLDWLEEEAGYDLVLWFQSWRSDFVTFLFKPFDLIGSEYFYILLIAFIPGVPINILYIICHIPPFYFT